jgi:hypothetical protein
VTSRTNGIEERIRLDTSDFGAPWLFGQLSVEPIIEAVGCKPPDSLNSDKLKDDIVSAKYAFANLEMAHQTDEMLPRPLPKKQIMPAINAAKRLERLAHKHPAIIAAIGKSHAETSAALTRLAARQQSIPTPINYIAGVMLPLIFEEHFKQRATATGPYIDFALAIFKQWGLTPSPDTIATALGRLSKQRSEQREFIGRQKSKI